MTEATYEEGPTPEGSRLGQDRPYDGLPRQEPKAPAGTLVGHQNPSIRGTEPMLVIGTRRLPPSDAF
jgi:hypothetical protein